ncbi:hypothetical protein [Nocardia cyriacigeorgica]|uniref:hypothetical protein n=1 Tax=Nocardia cyriacigeorgica TaxID=135487 RepID=UPI001E5F6F74|nr:hypothetical protein [Nocardia cyriacigeorgica]
MRKWWTAVGVAVLAGSLSTGVTVAPAGAAACGDSPWVGSWMAAPSDSFGAADPSLVPQLSVSNQTYRVVITPHRGGSVVRIHLTNRTRPVPMEVGHVTVAPQTTGGSVRAEALREVTFGGRREVSIPAGAMS